MEEERKHLHKAIEKEHRLIVSEKAKVGINNRLKSTDRLIDVPDHKADFLQKHSFGQVCFSGVRSLHINSDSEVKRFQVLFGLRRYTI